MKFIPKIFPAIIFLTGCVKGLTNVTPPGTHQTNDQYSYHRDIGEVVNFINREIQLSDSAFISQQNKMLADEYFKKGFARMDSKDTNDLRMARQYFKASLALDDSYPDLWMYLGEVSLQEILLNNDSLSGNKAKEAIYYFSMAIEMDSSDNLFWYRRGVCYMNLKDTAYRSDYLKACSLGNTKACTALREIEKE